MLLQFFLASTVDSDCTMGAPALDLHGRAQQTSFTASAQPVR